MNQERKKEKDDEKIDKIIKRMTETVSTLDTLASTWLAFRFAMAFFSKMEKKQLEENEKS